MKYANIVIPVLAAAVVGGGAFYGGMKYDQAHRPAGQFGRNGGQNRFGRNGRPVMGEIISKDDKSITVKMPDGSTRIVLYSDTTTINMASVAAKTDLAVGTKVGVFGTDNSDGSVTAQSIQLNPMFRGQQNQ